MKSLKKIWNDIPNYFLCTVFAILEWFTLFYAMVEMYLPRRQMFPAVATFLFLTFSMIALYGLIGKLHISVIIHNAIVSLYGLIQYFAVQLRGTICYMSDIYNLKTATNVANNYSLKFDKHFWISFVCIVGISCLAFLLKQRKCKDIKKRITTFCFGTIMTVASVGLMLFIEDTYSYNQYFNGYARNGYIYEFIGTMDVSLKEPDGYNTSDYKETIGVSYTDKMKELNPNVLIVMSESFIDSDTYDFGETEDLMPFLHSLSKDTNCISGTLYSSVLGGMTSCMEFETLTGHSSYFSGNVVQYTAYMRDGNKYGSLAHVFNELGYATTAFHPYLKSGYNRQTAYKTMGFQNYVAIEDLKDAEKGLTIPGRPYVSDEYDYEKVMEIIKSTDERDFIMNITMQNHSVYVEEELTAIDKVTDTGIDSLDNYLYLLSLTDKATEQLITDLKSFEEPTVVVFFGDHQPREMVGYSQATETSVYEVPYYIWANFDINTDIENTDITSANFLAPIMFEAVWGQQPNGWYEYLMQLRNEYPVISQNAVFDINRNLVNTKLLDYEKKAYYAVWDQENKKGE